MGVISLQSLARALVAALFLAVFATCAHAATAGDGANGGPGPSGPGPTGGHGQNEPAPGGDASAGCGGGLELAAPSPFGDPGDAVKALSRATQKYIKECRCVSQQCVADALDRYAEALAIVAPRLPPDLQNMPNVVAQAARRVRVARTKTEAVRAVNEAIAIVHKDIALVRAEDPDPSGRETRSGGFVADTLSVASLSLEKGGGL